MDVQDVLEKLTARVTELERRIALNSAVSEDVPPGRMSISDWEKTPEFLALTKKRRMFARTYIESGKNRILSVQAAYNIASREVARKNSYVHLADPKVRRALARYHGEDIEAQENRQVVKTLRARIDRLAMGKGKITPSQVEVLRLACLQHGLTFADAAARPPALPEPEATSSDVEIAKPVPEPIAEKKPDEYSKRMLERVTKLTRREE
jgi:hypothetical protein